MPVVALPLNRRVVLLHFAVFLALVLGLWANPNGSFVLVVTDPRAPAGAGLAVIGAAGGSYVGSGRFAWMSVGYSEQADFPARLMRAGAFLVVNHALAMGCQQRDLK